MSAANPPDTKPRLASDPPPGGLRESGARKGHNPIARPVWLAPEPPVCVSGPPVGTIHLSKNTPDPGAGYIFI